MKIFSNFPIDIVYNILTYTNHVKLRNGKTMFQIPKNDPRINMLLEKYRLINELDMYTPKVRLLNDNHYIRSGYATIKVEKNHYRQIIRVEVVKFERFKNGNIKQKSKVHKYSHVIADTH